MAVGLRPLRWRSPEFVLYYVVVALGLAYGIHRAWKFSSRTTNLLAHYAAHSSSLAENPNFAQYGDRLSPGWLFGPMVDASDAQWRSFRTALPSATAMFLAYTLLGIVLRRVEQRRGITAMASRVQSRALIAVGGLVILHGLNALKILTLLTISYTIGKHGAGGRKNVGLTWIYACAVLFALEYLKLSSLAQWCGPLRWLSARFSSPALAGFFPRWYVTFNITILRLISFNLDYYNAHHAEYQPNLLQHQEGCRQCNASASGELCERLRMQLAPELEAFSYASFLAYVLYLPLYIAGPIITFNNFYSQLARPPKIPRRQTLAYGLRWVASLLVLEVLLHSIYCVAIKDARAWRGFAPVDFFMLIYFNLKVVWLKLLVIWRFFRLWAMLDGICPTENMERCITNVYSGMAFWRSWHRSFNQWIVRYMYIPLGGSRRAPWNIWPIFTFVAIWHDLRLHLLVWSWLICLFILPEALLGWASRRLEWERHPQYLRGLAAAAAANMCLMALANMVGFVLGVDGVLEMARSTSLVGSLRFLFGLLGVFYCGASLLIEIRATERARGVVKNF